jgi:hypothetical protein
MDECSVACCIMKHISSTEIKQRSEIQARDQDKVGLMVGMPNSKGSWTRYVILKVNKKSETKITD